MHFDGCLSSDPYKSIRFGLRVANSAAVDATSMDCLPIAMEPLNWTKFEFRIDLCPKLRRWAAYSECTYTHCCDSNATTWTNSRCLDGTLAMSPMMAILVYGSMQMSMVAIALEASCHSHSDDVPMRTADDGVRMQVLWAIQPD